MSGFGKDEFGVGSWGGEEAPVAELSETVTVSEALAVVYHAVVSSTTITTVQGAGFGQSLFGQDPWGGTPSGILATGESVAVSDTIQVNVGVALSEALTLSEGLAIDQETSPTFRVGVQTETKIQVVFESQMNVNAAYVDVGNYTVTHIGGTNIPVNSVTALDDRHVEIILGASLVAWNFYSLTIDPAVQTLGGESMDPPVDLFQWANTQPPFLAFDISNFSGEVSTGLLGQPAGQVFFSPALEVLAANSIIQIDEVSVCTKAFDTYTFPEIPDPPLLMTYPAPATVMASSLLNGPGGLFATAERMGLPRVNLADYPEDTYTPPVDGPADATLVETIDITRAGFLNDTRWETFPAATASIGAFTLADNLTPIGPGPTTNIPLQP